MKDLKELLLSNEDWLMARILFYAKRQNYTKYTSTLIEAWRLSISGLSETILMAVDTFGENFPEFSPDEDYSQNPIVAFGVREARRHRKRGVNLGMFMGLLKYYRQTYQDLIREKIEDPSQGARYGAFIVRCFDLFDLAMTVEWNQTPVDKIIDELQRANRQLANEKNRYLTFFESIADPVFLINEDLLIENYNVAAARLLEIKETPGGDYYNRPKLYMEKDIEKDQGKFLRETIIGRNLGDVLPWMAGVLVAVGKGENNKLHRELRTEISRDNKYFTVILSGMRDVSGKFEGAVVVIVDITERRHLEEKILKLASTDTLTGVHNRRSFMEKANAEVVRSRRYHHPMAVLMIDIDHFKNINDTYGHHAGDLALKVFAENCLGTLRENDIFGRIGGEEFAAILTETTEKIAFQVAERLRTKISESIISDGAFSFKLQASIGIAALQDGETKLENIMGKADQAMYSAKRLGRNRVVSASGKYQPPL